MVYTLPELKRLIRQEPAGLMYPYKPVGVLQTGTWQGPECEQFDIYNHFINHIETLVALTNIYKQSLSYGINQRTDRWHTDATHRLKAADPGVVFVYTSHTPTLFQNGIVTENNLIVFSQDRVHMSPAPTTNRLFMRVIIP